MRIVQIVGYKNAGKTTLAEKTVRALSARGLRVGAVKRDAHEFEPDVPGTDSRKLREAGAAFAAISSPGRTALFLERTTPLEELLDAMKAEGIQAVVVEGFKTEPHPKIVILRDENDADLLLLPNLLAVALRESADPVRSRAESLGLPVYPADSERLLAFICSILSPDDGNDVL